MPCSQADCLSQIVLTHALRQATVWLMADVRQKKMRIIILLLIGIGLSGLLTLALPSKGETWASNSKHYFVGAEVYTEKEVVDMLNGRITKLSGNITPEHPMAYAKRIIDKGLLIEPVGVGGVGYYVVPRLHPKLDIFIPSLCMIGIGIFAYLLFYEKREPASISRVSKIRNEETEPNQ